MSNLLHHSTVNLLARMRSSCLCDLGPVAAISVNFNHQLAYFADQSDPTHVTHQPTAVA